MRPRPLLSSGSCTGLLARVPGTPAGDATEPHGRRITILLGFGRMQHLYRAAHAAREHQRSIHEACLPIMNGFFGILRAPEVGSSELEEKCESSVRGPADTNLRLRAVTGLCRASRGGQTAPDASGRKVGERAGARFEFPGVGKGLIRAFIVVVDVAISSYLTAEEGAAKGG